MSKETQADIQAIQKMQNDFKKLYDDKVKQLKTTY